MLRSTWRNAASFEADEDVIEKEVEEEEEEEEEEEDEEEEEEEEELAFSSPNGRNVWDGVILILASTANPSLPPFFPSSLLPSHMTPPPSLTTDMSPPLSCSRYTGGVEGE